MNAQAGVEKLQRSYGAAHAGFAVLDGRTRLRALRQAGSAKAIILPGPASEVVFLNTSGGLTGSDRLDDFKRNPQQFIELAADTINRRKRLAVVDGIKYQRLGDEHYYAQELFEQEELTGYLKNLLEVKKSVYEQVVYDSGTEAAFADELEKNDAVKVYAKLPGWFKVPTPLGTYNPDWAVLVEQDGAERLYFVVETKGSLFPEELRGKEGAKIDCAKVHFAALRDREKIT